MDAKKRCDVLDFNAAKKAKEKLTEQERMEKAKRNLLKAAAKLKW